MTAATPLVHRLAGAPEPPGALVVGQPGVCAVCARHVDHTADVARALGANFTDQSLWRARSDRVCTACYWCAQGKPPATLRMWTVVACRDLPDLGQRTSAKAWLQDTPGLCLTSRADTRPVIDLLTAPPAGEWVVSVAISGQKHVLPYAEVNTGTGRWRVRMETVTVSATPGEFAAVHASALALRRLGHRADDIAAGTPTLAACRTRDQVDQWDETSRRLAPWLRSPLLALALWTITKTIIEEQA